MRSKGLEAIKAIEEERNKNEAKNLGEDRILTGARGGSGGGDKQFKQPAGPLPEKNSLEYTPLQADNWKADMKLFVKTCSNLQVLSIEDQRTLMKRFVHKDLWPLVELDRADEMGTMIKKVSEAYDRQVPKFGRSTFSN